MNVLLKKLMVILLFTLGVIFAQEEHKTLEIGSHAPDFKLKGIDGKTYTLKSFDNADILVIIFTANHCPTAQAYESRIMKLVNDYKSKNVQVICISSNNPEALRLDEMGYTDLGDTMEEMKLRAKEKNFNFPYLYDGDEQLTAKAYGPQATPHVFVFDKERILRYTGRVDDSEKYINVKVKDTNNAIDALLQGKKISVEQTKTFGCSMKWAYKKESAKQAVDEWNKEKVELQSASLEKVSEILKNRTDNLELINFWATWCGPCTAELPELVAINRMYRNREFEMITISMDNPTAKNKVLKFLQKKYASTKNYMYDSDNKYKLIDAVGNDWSGALPLTLLVEPGGKVIYKKQGMIDNLELKKAIVEYLGRYYK